MDNVKVKYSLQARELALLLKEDQAEWREYAHKEHSSRDEVGLHSEKELLRQHVQQRAKRVLEILDEVGEPSISNIGSDGALAMSVLATHASLEVTHLVLKAFELYVQSPSDTRKESIPAMTDWIAILEHRQQKFGTIWLMDKNGQPFLPTVKDFDSIDDSRAKYGIEPLRWPRSLAIPVEDQPWLAKPLSQLVMRDPTDEEYAEFVSDTIAV